MRMRIAGPPCQPETASPLIRNTTRPCTTAVVTTSDLRRKKWVSHTDAICAMAPTNWGMAVNNEICGAVACKCTANALKKLSPVAVITADGTASRCEQRNVLRSGRLAPCARLGFIVGEEPEVISAIIAAVRGNQGQIPRELIQWTGGCW